MKTTNIKFFKVFFIITTTIFSLSYGKQKTWNVKDFGAIDDNKTINTQAIQNAINSCNKAGGGTVIIDGNTFISGTLLLKTNVNLKITKNTTLLASVNPNDFPAVEPFIDATGQYRGQCFIGAIDVKNVSISGKGTIDGRGTMFTPKKIKETIKELGITINKPDLKGLIAESKNYVSKTIRVNNRPFLIRIIRSQNIQLNDIHLRQPAAWTLHFLNCTNFEVDGIDIYSHANKNNDAIDIDSSTHGIIKNCTINSGDDAICFKSTSPSPTTNIKVFNCQISSGWGALKFGTESMGDFKDIVVKNCLIHDTRGGGIKVLSADGANVNNIVIKNITMKNVEMPIFIRLCERRLVYRGAQRKPVGSINNVVIKNIKAHVSDQSKLRMNPTTGFYFSGTPNHKLGTIRVKNVKVELPGGGTKADAAIVVPENETQYPEFTKLGITPSYGLFARHIEHLNTKNISFALRNKDERKEIIKIDTN